MSPRKKVTRPRLELHTSTKAPAEPEPPVPTDEDMDRLMGAVKRQVYRQVLSIADRIGVVAEACMRFGSVALYCRHVRSSRGETVKDAAKAAKLPQYVIQRIEEGDVMDIDLGHIEKYVAHLGLEGWFGEWARANGRLMAMLVQPPALRESLDPLQLERFAAAAQSAMEDAPGFTSPPTGTVRAVLQLEIVLEESEPRIWRRIVIASDSTLHQLHRAIQVAMGWTDSHLYAFEIGDHQFSDVSILDEPQGFLDSRKFRLADLAFREGSRFGYRYDFGDDWNHLVRVEAVTPVLAQQRLPWCLAGERACPPEDSGGMYGYREVLKSLGDRRHPEHAETLRWVPEGFDPEAFDLEETNRRLTRTGGGNRR